jgi:hypothetical protein
MTKPEYQALSRGEIGLLLAPENADAERAWDSLTGALHGLIAVLSDTHPRPLYFYEEADRVRVAEQLERLRGTPFYAVAAANARAAEVIERMARERGNSPELQKIVDRYVDTLLDEYDAARLYPAIPPRRRLDEGNWLARSYRAVAGR